MVRRMMRRAGYHAVPATFYSPIPDIDRIPSRVWTEPQEMPGIAWDLDGQVAFMERELGDLMAEFKTPLNPPGDEAGFYLRNPNFPGLDAEVAYAMVRRFRPSTVVELGAGYSTLVIAAAAERVRLDGSAVVHEVYDPFPSPILARVSDRIELHDVPATDVDVERFAAMKSRDILFIDTTHTVKPGGDVIHLILGALPLVRPGVIVHVHDFYRPFEYPYAIMDVFGSYWQEHHLVQAFLVLNPEFEILCGNHALWRLRADRVRDLLPQLDEHASPSSLWLRRRLAH